MSGNTQKKQSTKMGECPNDVRGTKLEWYPAKNGQISWNFKQPLGNPQYWDISTSRYCSTHKSPEKCFKSSCDLPSLQASTCWARKLRNNVVVDPWPDMVHHMVSRNLDLHWHPFYMNLDAVICRTKSLQSRQKHSFGYNTMGENDWHILTSECIVRIYLLLQHNLTYSRLQ